MSAVSTSQTESGYRPIEDYGLIGDMHTVALVGKDGSIDWCCLPRFDAPSVFARVLDAETGGHFQIALCGEHVTTKQFYWPETNVLVTRFLSDDGVGEVRDFMPVAGRASETDRRQIIRMVRAVRGTVTFRVECRPAFDYARADHETVRTERGVCFHGDEQALSLAMEIDLARDGDGVAADVTLREGESTTLLLRDIEPGEGCAPTLSSEAAEQAFRDTVQFWHDWLGQCTYTGRWREEVRRSALVLKLLTYEPTGAIVAAPTCSLPENVGGVRNWDYRYTWIRDAAFTLYAFLRIGFTCASALPRRRARSSDSSPSCAGWTQPARGRSRSCTASTGRPSSPSRPSTTWRATASRRRSASATGPTTSSSSTFTGSSSTPSTYTTSTACPSPTRRGSRSTAS
jgi:GH15 family glucan-1,4-alpha-glucosidase